MKFLCFIIFTGYSFFFIFYGKQPQLEYALLTFTLADFFLNPWMAKKIHWMPYLRIFLITIAVALIFVGHIKYFLIQPYTVSSESMLPKLHPGDTILVEKFSMGLIINYYERDLFIKRLTLLWERKLHVGDIAIFHQPGKKEFLIKRVHSLEGDKYCMYGDNREHSLDSRVFGCIEKEYIIGRYLRTLSQSH